MVSRAPTRDQLGEHLLARFGVRLDTFSPTFVDAMLDRVGTLDLASADGTAALIASFSVAETMFLRHRAQFDLLRDHLARRAPGPLRVWSAGCSTGEEAWSLAGRAFG